MGKIIQTIKKNLNVLLKNKLSLVILFLGPLLIILMMGFFYYNNNVYNINLGVYMSDKNNENTIIFLDEIKASGLNVIEYESKNSCDESLKNGFAHACLIFPENFEIKENKTNEIIIRLDESRGDIVSITQNLLVDQISAISQNLQIKYTNELINVISKAELNSLESNDMLNNLTLINDNLKKTNNLIEKQIIQIDYAYRPENLDIDKVDVRIEKYNDSLYDFVLDTNLILNDTYNGLTNLSTLLSSSNNTIVYNRIINDAKTNIDTAMTKTNAMKTDYYFTKLQSDFTILKNNLENVKININDLTVKLDEDLKANQLESENIDSFVLNMRNNNNELLNNISTITVRDPLSIVRAVSVKVDNLVPNSTVHLNSLLPSLIVSLIFIISIILSSTFVLGERKSMAFFRNFMTKTSAIKFLLSDFITLVLIVFVQISIIILMYYIFFLRMITKEMFYLEIAILPIISVFVLIGMLIGYLTNNETANVILSFFVIFIFLAFSGLLLPIEILSKYLLNITLLNPYLLSEAVVRNILLFQTSIVNLKLELMIIGMYVLILFFINLIMESINKKRGIYTAYVSFELAIKKKFKKKN